MKVHDPPLNMRAFTRQVFNHSIRGGWRRGAESCFSVSDLSEDGSGVKTCLTLT
jgi:hypothetical protein